MLNEATYKDKYLLLKDWMPAILDTVKKDIKNEHLRQDVLFVKKYLNNKSLNKVTHEEFVAGYNQAIAEEEKAEDIAEFIFNRWLVKHSDVYSFFEQELTRIHPNFTDIKELQPGPAFEIMEDAVSHFGAVSTYLFSVINSVVFPATVLEQLKHRAKDEAFKAETHQQEQSEQLSRAGLIQKHEEQIGRLTDKYEKKLSGLEKKYFTDTVLLKKQIASLQRKLNDA